MLVITLILLIGFSSAVEISTTIGKIRGKYEQFSNRGVHKFLGIPYAEPPIDELRFRPPVAKERIEEPLDASRTGPICPQLKEHVSFFNFTEDPDANFDMSEDCLYMNIYVPSADRSALPGKLPVMFYIHSGGWTWGSGNHYDGRWLAMNGKVILVTFNYRLGILGFLRTDDLEVVNNGFKDQIMAFKWVRENIANFGGDPDKITVFGQSAGGASTIYLQGVPELYGQIKRVIPLGGLPGANWAKYSRVVQSLTDHVIQVSGCHENYLTCLKSKSVHELITITLDTMASMNMLTTWMPSPDYDVIGASDEFIVEGFRHIDFLGEMTVGEGTMLAFYATFAIGMDMKDEYTLEELMQLCVVEDQEVEHVAEAIKSSFTHGPVSDKKAYDFITEFATWYPLYKTARSHAEVTGPTKKTFVNVLDYAPDDKKGLFPRPDWQKKAGHGDELPLIFGTFLSEVSAAKSQKDVEMSKEMIKYLTNFVKTGDPNKPEPVGVEWKQFSGHSRRHLLLKHGGSSDKKFEFLLKSPEYWDKLHGVDVHRDEL